MTADLVGLVTAFLVLQLLVRAVDVGSDRATSAGEILIFAVGLPFWFAAASGMGLYKRDGERLEHTTVDDLVGVLELVTMLVWLIYVLSDVTGVTPPSLHNGVVFWGVAVVSVSLARSLARVVARRSPGYAQRAVIVGTDRVGQLIARKLLQHREFHTDVLGFVDGSPRNLRDHVAHLPVLGDIDDLIDIVERGDVDRVVIAFSRASSRQLMQISRQLQSNGVQVDIVPRLFEALGPNASINSVEGVQLVSLPPTSGSRASFGLKRTFDVLFVSTALMLTWPLLLVIAASIKLDSRGPVLFRQIRLGRNQRPFTVLKFRTMRTGTSQSEHREYIRRAMDSGLSPEEGGLYKLERQESVTRVGQWLRKTSLDELPQLFNVLRGDMSLVGPRPCIPYETEHFEHHHFERFSVPAGITGLWQVKARAHSTFLEALEMDVAYARSWSFARDLVLLLQTPLQIVRPRATK